jgi:carbon storage regulator
MLILKRRPGQVLHVGSDVKVTILAIKGNLVRVGFDAPRTVTVDRGEVAERKRTACRRTRDALNRAAQTNNGTVAEVVCTTASAHADVVTSDSGRPPLG